MAQPSAAAAHTTTEDSDRPLIDALPYFDDDITQIAKAEELINAEMNKFLPKNYLAHHPPVQLKFTSSLLNSEMDRISQGLRLPAVNPEKHQLQAPTGDQALLPSAWKAAIDAAKIQIEHEELRTSNLELLKAYGANAWIAHTTYLQQLRTQLQHQVTSLESEIEALNRTRKIDHLQAGTQLRQLEAQWAQLVAKNFELQLVVQYLDATLQEHRPAAAEKQE